MKCIKIQKLIDPYIDGDLKEKEIKAFNKHINECGLCRREFELALALKDELESIDTPEVEPNWNNVENKLGKMNVFSDHHTKRYKTDKRSSSSLLPTGLFDRLLPAASALAALMIFIVISAVLIKIIPESVRYYSKNDVHIIKEIKAAERTYRLNLLSLENYIDIKSKDYSNGILKFFERERKIVDKNINRSRRLVYLYPQDENIREIFLTSYDTKYKLYRKIYELMQKKEEHYEI